MSTYLWNSSHYNNGNTVCEKAVRKNMKKKYTKNMKKYCIKNKK